MHNKTGKKRNKSFLIITKRTIVLTLIAWLISFVVIQGLILHTANLNEESGAKYVIVLGAGLWDGEPSPTLLNRLKATIEYLENNENAIAIVSGGLGQGETITEAKAMKNYLINNGIDESRIFKEENARNTKENIVNSRKILSEKNDWQNEDIVIISSEFHLFRARFLARRIGLDPQVISAETPEIVKLKYFIREYFAVIKSFIFDTT